VFWCWGGEDGTDEGDGGVFRVGWKIILKKIIFFIGGAWIKFALIYGKEKNVWTCEYND
jgi:hypothetical protein